MKNIVIAIDGHSSCGKSTVAKAVAKHLGIAYIDTGAMYRAVTLFALRNGLIADGKPDADAIVAHLDDIKVTFDFDKEKGRNTTFLNGENVEDEIRGMVVSNLVSPVSAIPAVRARLTDWQREMGSKQSVIMDGRDIGTVVFPGADLKIFMTARPEVRAKRRYDELCARGENANYDEILANVLERDRQDSTRAVAPLRKADDAIELDNSDLTHEEQFNFVIDKVKNIGGANA